MLQGNRKGIRVDARKESRNPDENQGEVMVGPDRLRSFNGITGIPAAGAVGVAGPEPSPCPEISGWETLRPVSSDSASRLTTSNLTEPKRTMSPTTNPTRSPPSFYPLMNVPFLDSQSWRNKAFSSRVMMA